MLSLSLSLSQQNSTKRIAKSSYGFSLVELLVVVAILAILAAIAIPLFLNQKNKAKTAAMKSDMHNAIMDMKTLQPDTTGTAIPVSPAPDTTMQNGGFRKSPSVYMRLFPNCAVNTASNPPTLLKVSNGDFVLTSIVEIGSSHFAVEGTPFLIYDSAGSKTYQAGYPESGQTSYDTLWANSFGGTNPCQGSIYYP